MQRATIQILLTCHVCRFPPHFHNVVSHYNNTTLPSTTFSTTRRLLSLHAATQTSFHESLRAPTASGSRALLLGRAIKALVGTRRASAVALPRCVASRYATAWAESLEEAMRGHQSWALLCRCRFRLLLAEIPNGVDRNSETYASAVGKKSSDWPGPGSAKFWTTSQSSNEDAAADRRTAREASMCPNSPRLHQQSREGTGRRRKGLCRLPQKLDHTQPSFHGARALELTPAARVC